MRLTKAQKERDALLLARFRVYREWCLPREVRQCIEIRTRTANQQLYEDCKHLAQTSRGRKRDLGRALERVGCAERHAHALCQSFIRGSAHVSWTARGVAHEMARQKYLLEHSGAFKREIGAMAAKINKRLHELVMARGRVESVRDDSIVYERIRSEATRDVTGAETFAAAAASVARHWPVVDFPSIALKAEGKIAHDPEEGRKVLCQSRQLVAPADSLFLRDPHRGRRGRGGGATAYVNVLGEVHD